VNIGLIAVSGTRACDQELMRLGLTLPGFVERSQIVASLPSLGLLTLAGMTPEKDRLSYLEVPEPERVERVPDGFDLVAISSYSAQIFEAYDLASRFREAGVPVVLGGPHVSHLPQEAAGYADAVVIGEGEASWLELLSDAESGRLQPCYGQLNGPFDLRDAPVPAYDLLDISRYNRLTVQTSRGCPHLCEFCGGTVLLCSRYKQKPVAKVLEEIDRILALWERPFLEFADDNSLVDRSYWKELLRALQQKSIRWFAETDIAVADDDELLELMRRSGCAQVLVGLESPIEAGLEGLELRADWKRKRWPRYREAIARIQSHGIAVNGCFMVGLDGHGPEIFEAIPRFVRESGLYEVQITIPTPFPGTPFYARLKREGRLLEDRRWDKCTLFDINFRPSRMSVEALDRGFKDLATRLYSEETTRERRRRFKQYLRRDRQRGVRP
jgi:radical SAM superfamily enzyme YgiQ (UPF0313 family)